MTFTIPESVTIPIWILVLSMIFILVYPHYSRWFDRVWEDKLYGHLYIPPEGFIYLMLRMDGIYKIGQTVELEARREALSRQYHQPVFLVKAWPVPNLSTYEKKVLSLTRRFEYHDGSRETELRRMTISQAALFITVFTAICGKMREPDKFEVLPVKVKGWKQE